MNSDSCWKYIILFKYSMDEEIVMHISSNVIKTTTGLRCQYTICGRYRKYMNVWNKNILKLCCPRNAMDFANAGCRLMLWKSSTMSIAVAVSKTSAGGISILSGKAATVIMASAIVSHLLRLLCITLFINLLHGGS